MADVCVITGGGSGMGFEAARFTPNEKILVLSGRTVEKLEKAKEQLEAEGHTVHTIACDVSVRKDVHELAYLAASLGTIKNVIHAAGMSPSMGSPEDIIKINAIGTKNVNMEFYKYMNDGGVIVDVASSSAYQAPAALIKHQIYEEAEYKEDIFYDHMVGEARLAPGEYEKSGLAYAMSKNFVVWYAKKCAFAYAEKGIRVVSVSPGLVETKMGEAEAEHAQSMIEMTCEKRMGRPAELGYALATIADERNGYLCGIDVLIDGGASSGKDFQKK